MIPDTPEDSPFPPAHPAAEPTLQKLSVVALAPAARPAALENTLLAGLSDAVGAKLAARLEPFRLSFGDMLYQPGAKIVHVYFPGSALVSLLAVAEQHLALEVALVGREGLVGVSVVLGSDASSIGALVQGSGTSLRMGVGEFRRECRASLPLLRAVLGYTDLLVAQIAQTAACNHFHVADQRLARWLLMSSDRLLLDHFRMTHEFLGHMLGVRRVGVTEAAQKLQRGGLIAYRRGDITILDRPGLEAAACGCYATLKALYARPPAVERPSQA